jgi:hypothetical protein
MKPWVGKFAAVVLAVAGVSMASSASAAVLTEDFNAPFPAWESGWLATNSNLQNIYGVGAGRGNNPDGLWIFDGIGDAQATIDFKPSFGSTILGFSIDVTTFVTAYFTAYDMSGAELITTPITSLGGAFTAPGSYQTIAFKSTNGLSRFVIGGSGVEGNTSIDNVVVTTADAAVPEPASFGLLALGAAGLLAARGRNKR